MARYASYQDFAEIIRLRFQDPRATLHELFVRLMFIVLVGNTDDHARNHAAFWDGHALNLTPAYDSCPQGRRVAPALPRTRARDRAGAVQIEVIRMRYREVCDEASLSEVDRDLLWRRQFLNPFAFDGAPAELLARGERSASEASGVSCRSSLTDCPINVFDSPDRAREAD